MKKMKQKKLDNINGKRDLDSGLEFLLDRSEDFKDKKAKKLYEGNECLGQGLEKRCSKHRKAKKNSDAKNLKEFIDKNDLSKAYDSCISRNRIERKKEEVLKSSILPEYAENQIIEARVLDKRSTDIDNVPVVTATAIVLDDNVGNETVIKDKSLRIAKDFVGRNKIILVGGKKYLYNKVFYSLLKDRELQNMLFRYYYNEISQGNALAVLNNAAKLSKYGNILMFFENLFSLVKVS